MTVVDDFVTLFRGRGDAYGDWNGGCIRERVDRSSFERHLGNGPFIGVYPCVGSGDDTKCVWGCTDIDKTDDPAQALAIQAAFDAVGVKAWVERTAHGWHVWVFCTELVSARLMRNMFLAAHQVVDVPPKEVNPKQPELAPGQLGNYVRLPYYAALMDKHGDHPISGTRRMVIDSACAIIGLEEFLVEALAQRVTPETVAKLADYYIEPIVRHVSIGEPTASALDAARGLTPLGKLLFRDGPLEGRDRSTTLTHLAHETFKAGITPGNALVILKDADQRWGKYLNRNQEHELVKLVERAHGSSPSS